jgi:hypothetical protein
VALLSLPPRHFVPPCHLMVSTTRVVDYSTQRRVGGLSFVVLYFPPQCFVPPCHLMVSTTRVVDHSTQRRVGWLFLYSIIIPISSLCAALPSYGLDDSCSRLFYAVSSGWLSFILLCLPPLLLYELICYCIAIPEYTVKSPVIFLHYGSAD